jgi:hypothetical protein
LNIEVTMQNGAQPIQQKMQRLTGSTVPHRSTKLALTGWHPDRSTLVATSNSAFVQLICDVGAKFRSQLSTHQKRLLTAPNDQNELFRVVCPTPGREIRFTRQTDIVG